jgi:hypothetical protein
VVEHERPTSERPREEEVHLRRRERIPRSESPPSSDITSTSDRYARSIGTDAAAAFSSEPAARVMLHATIAKSPRVTTSPSSLRGLRSPAKNRRTAFFFVVRNR